MNKVDRIMSITARVLREHKGSIPREAFVETMAEATAVAIEPSFRPSEGDPVPGLQIIKSPYATAGDLAELLSGSCPPFRGSGEVDCRNVSCRDCWAAWLTTGKPAKPERKE